MIILMFGPPGSGKGTHSKKLAEYLKIPHISTGDIFRDHMKKETDIGKKILKIMNSGNLVSDKITNEIIKDRLNKNDVKNGFILDGYPRKFSQISSLDSVVEKINKVIFINTAEKECIKRLQERAFIEGRTDDGDIKIIKDRFKIYKDETLPCIKEYKKRNILIEINGMGNISEVFDRIKISLKS